MSPPIAGMKPQRRRTTAPDDNLDIWTTNGSTVWGVFCMKFIFLCQKRLAETSLLQ